MEHSRVELDILRRPLIDDRSYPYEIDREPEHEHQDDHEALLLLELCQWSLRGIRWRDRKSTRLNSSHSQISYAVFCLKKKKNALAIIPPRYDVLPRLACEST